MDLGFHWSWLAGKFVPDTWQGFIFWSLISIAVVGGIFLVQKLRGR